MIVVLHTFGTSQTFYLQSTFLIINLLQYRDAIDSITVVTEDPSFYKRVEKFINILPVSGKILNEWKGESGFLYRIKLKALELIISQAQGNETILYLDTDTFVYQGFNEIKSSLLSGKGLMHNNEGKLSECPTRSGSRMWKGIKDQTFDGNRLTSDDCMWNAGVIGIPAGISSDAIKMAINMCDDMCKVIPPMFLIEQFCMSVTLQRKVEMQAANGWIGHYWSNRDPWNQLISTFINESYMKGCSLEEDIERMRNFNFRQIPIANIPTNSERKLHSLVNKLYKPRVYLILE